jgi:TolA-binding protein
MKPRPRRQPAVDVPAPVSEAAPGATRPSWPGESEFRDGWSAYQRGDYGHAAEWLRKSCRNAGDGAIAEDACFWYAVALDRGSQADAITAYRSFLQRWPASRRGDEARVQLAALLVADGDRDAARGLLRDAARSTRSTTRDAALRALRELGQ